MIVEDRDALVHRILHFPVGGLHHLARAAHGDGHGFGAEPQCGAAAIHGGVAAADHDHASADFVDMAERNRRQEINADFDVCIGLAAAGNIEIFAFRRAGADEHRVKTFTENGLKAFYLMAEACLDAELQDANDFLVKHRFRQAERRNIGAHQTAALGVFLKQRDAVAQRQEVPRDGQ